MRYVRKSATLAWLALGLAVGLVVGGLLPQAPLHAVATDRLENFAMATGYVDEGVEAVYFLDVLTGTLKAAVVSNQTTGFQAKGEANLNADLMKVVQLLNGRTSDSSRSATAPRPQVQVPTAPNYVMVTGIADLRRQGPSRTRPSRALVYVGETNTGIVMAYVMHWDQSMHAANAPYVAPLTLFAFDQFTTAVVRSP